MAQTPAIRLADVSLVYQGAGREVRALDGVSLEIPVGQRVCVLGANGSGKSTLASVIAGLMAPDAGTVELVGERVCTEGQADFEAYRRARRLLGLVFQNPGDQIVTSVVEEDVAFGPENLGLPRETVRRRVDRELARVAMTDYAQADPSRLSGGQQQRVAIAGALAMDPRVLVLDEPSALLDVRGRAAILRVLGRLRRIGCTIVHITHFMDEAVEADRVVVLDHGHVALDGTPTEVFSHADELRTMRLDMPFAADLSCRLRERGVGVPVAMEAQELARSLAPRLGTVRLAPEQAPEGRATGDRAHASVPSGKKVLQLEDVTYSYRPGLHALEHVSLEVGQGERVALVGQTGSGKSTLLRLAAGLERPDAGRVVVAGIDTSTKRGRCAAHHAVGYVMQHPERQLFAQTVWEDVAFGPRNMGLTGAELEACVRDALELTLLDSKAGLSPFELSGGQRRRCAIAGVIAMRPHLLLLDEPTAGLDPHGCAGLHAILDRLHAEGVTIVEVTHSMEDAAQADRVVVLDQSRVLLSGSPAEVFSEANEVALIQHGLGVPAATSFSRVIRRLGVPVEGDALGVGELADALAAACRGGRS